MKAYSIAIVIQFKEFVVIENEMYQNQNFVQRMCNQNQILSIFI